MVVGSFVPLVTNILGTTKIINISIYVTPILFVLTLICYAIAIFKYKALNLVPIALKTIMDTMTDAFIVISLDGTIVNQNREYKEKVEEYIGNTSQNFFELLKNSKYEQLNKLNGRINQSISEQRNIITEVHLILDEKEQIDKFFEFNISLIRSKNNKQNVGVLILIKDITQHKKDLKALEEKQEIIVKQAQLVSIGELAGGVAHDINTPISAIKTGITMLKKINDKRDESEAEIIDNMENCSNKIISIVNSMRNQIRNLGGNTDVIFKVSSVIEDVKCITYHEAKKYKVNVKTTIEDDLSVKGDPSKLGQVLTNLVVNAIQAYKGISGGNVEVIVTKGPSNSVVIKVIDFAGGIEDEIASKIFSSILTTKGIEGTGLGLYLAYSVIKGNFNGEINFDTKIGMGSTFYISIPLAENVKEKIRS